MRVVTWNIQGALGMDGVRSLERIADTLLSLDADVVCLQEVHRQLPRGAKDDQPAALARMLDMQVVFHSALRFSSRFGNGILSRWPLHNGRCHGLPNREERKRPGLWMERRIVQQVDVETPDGHVTMLNTHWGLGQQDRLGSAEVIVRVVQTVPGRLVLCGDLNALPDAPEVAHLRIAGLLDAGAARNEATYPANIPRARIDYIWIQNCGEVEVKSIESLSSDHLPVIADVRH